MPCTVFYTVPQWEADEECTDKSAPMSDALQVRLQVQVEVQVQVHLQVQVQLT